MSFREFDSVSVFLLPCWSWQVLFLVSDEETLLWNYPVGTVVLRAEVRVVSVALGES